ARRPDRAAKISSPELRRDGRFAAHRYSEGRRKAGEPPHRGSQLSRHRWRDRMDGDEAGAGNFRRGARECGKTKKVIEPFDKAQDRPMIESSCPSYFCNQKFARWAQILGRLTTEGPARQSRNRNSECLPQRRKG